MYLAGAPSTLIGLFVVLLAPICPAEAVAQLFSYGGDRPRAVQSVSFAYKVVDFNFDGEAPSDQTFEFEAPAYGVLYTRPSFSASITYGPETGDSGRDLRLLDAAITTWGEVVVGGSEGSSRIYIPIALESNYRRVAPRGSEDSLVDAFNLTVLGLGTGLGFSVDVTESVRFEGRATPVLGIALRAFGDSAGTSYLIDTDVRVHIMDLAGRIGVSAGYAFRTQVWNVDASDLLLGEQEDLFDYSGTQHLLTVGVNW